jgi:hypothetical protein
MYHCVILIANYFFEDLNGFKFGDRIRKTLASRITDLVLKSPGDHGNIVKTGSRVILNLYRDPLYKNQTSEKRYKVPTTALPPMRDLGSLILGKYCTFVCGSLFRVIKLIELYSPK